MNVVRNEKLFQPPRERNGAGIGAGAGARMREQFAVPSLTKYQLECDKRLRKQWKSASSGYSKTPSYRGAGRGRASTMTSTTFLPSSSRNYATRSGTRSTAGASSNAMEAGGNILAITTGRGEARTEVGMAALDIRCPYLILCQISDSQTYASALSKLYLFDPTEVLMPDTMCERATSRSVLCRSIVNKFSDLRVTPISRIHYNDANGLERIRTLCAPEYSSVELFVKEKYYALAAAAALLKYVEYAQRIFYTPKSMKIEFQGSPNTTSIDLESARSLELVQSQCGQRNVSLLGILDNCSTPMGRKLLRASILQPPCQDSIILQRQCSVAELVSNSSLRALLQPIVRRLYGADRLVALSIAPVFHENTVQCAEQSLNYVLLLKNLLDVVPELETALSAGESEILGKIRKNLENPRFRLMRERILHTIHPDARSVTGYTSANMQRCFAIKAGINDLLDIARQTYCELIDDMKSMVENLASKYKLTLSLACNASLGYHVQAIFPRDWNAEAFDPPAEFIEVRKCKRVYTMTTSALATLNQQCKIASEELHLMSNVLLSDLQQNLREYISCLFQLSSDVAELDLIISLARVSSLQTYVKPTFGRKLELLDSRHPVLEAFGLDSPVPNNVSASVYWNFHVITGPNMSGKSTYLKQIVLLHIMAQIGCFVPAKKMKEAQYVLRSVTSTSLIVLDELCKGTAIDEGASIAWAICERLSNTTAFVFAATHFVSLTKLAEVYCNVKNHHMETINLRGTDTDDFHGLTYTHRVQDGVAPIDDYGIVLAQLSGLPDLVTDKARRYASDRLLTDDPVAKISNDSEMTRCYDIVIRMYELLKMEKFHRDRVTNLLQCIGKVEAQKPGKENVEEANNANEKKVCVEEKNKDGAVNDPLTDNEIVCSKATYDATKLNIPKTNAGFEEIPASSTTTISCNNIPSPTESLQKQSSIRIFEGGPSDLNPCRSIITSFNSSSFSSIVTENTLSELERQPSASNNLNVCSMTSPGTILSFPLAHELSSPMQMSITSERSTPTLYEYFLSDDDFEPS